MEPASPYRPRIARETRLLLITALLAVTALWVLARVRLADLPAASNPVPQVLSQFAGGPRDADLTAQIYLLQSRLEPLLLPLEFRAAESLMPSTAPAQRMGFRIQEDLAITLLPPGRTLSEAEDDPRTVSHDAASGLAIVRVPVGPPVSAPVPWSAPRTAQPQYLFVTDVISQRVSLSPVFVGLLEKVTSPFWPQPVWLVPLQTDLVPGAFVFSINAELVGLVVDDDGKRVIVPGDVLLMESKRLLERSGTEAASVSVEVQPLTPGLSIATGATKGVVVTWVGDRERASSDLVAGDVIETVDGLPLATPQHWKARSGRVTVGETIVVGVRRSGRLREVRLTGVPRSILPASQALGLTMRSVPGIGVEIVKVEPVSVGERAGIASGDLITRIADVPRPTPAQIARVFGTSPEGTHLIVAITRGDRHRVTTLDK